MGELAQDVRRSVRTVAEAIRGIIDYNTGADYFARFAETVRDDHTG
ncbi:MAG: hypothetical protein MZV63_61590 [Marinilabiliales bacterium]|nr:hypothetical protein [Marinilabiliales bacterium]